MRRFLLCLTACLVFPLATGAQPANLAEVARGLPPLARQDGVVRLPLETTGPLAWRPVREGVSLGSSIDAGRGALTASYRVATGQPAGAALVVPPGTLAGVSSLRLAARGTRNGQLVVALRDSSGVTYAFPAVAVRPGDSRQAEVFTADLSYLAPASSGPDPGHFDPAGTVMITILDLAGFMGPETPETAWTLESFEGVLQ
jgi:hypothetical protein